VCQENNYQTKRPGSSQVRVEALGLLDGLTFYFIDFVQLLVFWGTNRQTNLDVAVTLVMVTTT
jgi:hypothetical protein